MSSTTVSQVSTSAQTRLSELSSRPTLHKTTTHRPASSIELIAPDGRSVTDDHTGCCTTVIVDLGDVLFSWSAKTRTTISPVLLKKILRSSSWFEYEKGCMEEDQVYEAVAHDFNVPASEVAAAIQGARDTLQSNPALIDLIKHFKMKNGIKFYAMSNISAPDWAVLSKKATSEEWSLFDRVFVSSEAKERKPNLGFYKYVLEATGVDPLKTVFVDDNLENVLSARSLGIKGIVFDTVENVSRQLRNLIEDPVDRGAVWLKENAKRSPSVTDSGIVIQENFARLLLFELTGDQSLIEGMEYPRLFNFFQGMLLFIDAALKTHSPLSPKPPGSSVLTTAEFPFDLDTTSMGLMVSTHIAHETKMGVMNEMLTYLNGDGIIQTYFDPTRPRIDPIVCINVLTLFYKYGRGDELDATLDWVYSVLLHRAYLDGTLYYHGADTFLFFLSRLVRVAPSIRARFASVFTQRCLERFGAEGDALALAMRITACMTVNIRNQMDYEHLLKLQEEDGSFPLGYLYKYGSSGILIGNKALTTALALKAIEAVRTYRH